MAKAARRKTQQECDARTATNGAPCGRAPETGPGTVAAQPGFGPGAHAQGVDPDIKSANLRHLRRIEGQIRGIAAMIEQDRYCADIIQQTAAAQESLRSVARNLLKNHLRHCATDALTRPGPRRDEMIEEVLTLVSKIAR